MSAMESSGLSPREAQALAQIEAELSADTRLARMLGAMRLRGFARVRYAVTHPRGHVMFVLLTACFALLVAGARTGSPAVIGVLGALWIVTLALGLLLIFRWVRRYASQRKEPS
ncbi:DUF3040 domain-containing protein [Yinghuangia seranimata]|uniref:DUF3040 domain-containing protein n=1 Tax=Yinghuangia seranimata TaxID=408067 RepID=UPI00248B627B|nr:DUF3040 domain-containing protein [Yinghuangia seranimata]MDI2125387.1 DUF3040 domain-containing protein [Yinghuangia seranimata]